MPKPDFKYIYKTQITLKNPVNNNKKASTFVKSFSDIITRTILETKDSELRYDPHLIENMNKIHMINMDMLDDQHIGLQIITNDEFEKYSKYNIKNLLYDKVKETMKTFEDQPFAKTITEIAPDTMSGMSFGKYKVSNLLDMDDILDHEGPIIVLTDDDVSQLEKKTNSKLGTKTSSKPKIKFNIRKKLNDLLIPADLILTDDDLDFAKDTQKEL